MKHISNKITLICYDISSDKLRRKIDKCLKDFGVRMQYSIFICRLDADGVAKCRKKLQNVLDKYHKEKQSGDSLIILERLNHNIVSCMLGSGIAHEIPTFAVF